MQYYIPAALRDPDFLTIIIPGFSMPQRQSMDSVRSSVGLEKENTMRFYIGVFEEEKDR